MRAFAGGYYGNLKAMYDHIGVPYHPQRFLFAFSQIQSAAVDEPSSSIPYFIHASNNHVLPPIRPQGANVLRHLCEVIFVTICYFWLTICSFLIRPLESEDYGTYVSRIKLPRYFVTRYILPLLCSVATCTPEALLAFPAQDIVNYKKLSHGSEHFVVSNGVHTVQAKLSDGLDPRLGTQVVRVEPEGSGVIVSWKFLQPGNGEKNTNDEVHVEHFDKVVLAVTPNVVADIFANVQQPMRRIPTTTVESIVLQPHEKRWRLAIADERSPQTKATHQRHASPIQRNQRTQVINLHSRFGSSNSAAGAPELTEAVHELDNHARVATCPFSIVDEQDVIHRSRFTRVLRSVESRNLLCRIFEPKEEKGEEGPMKMLVPEEKQRMLGESVGWRNGDGNVWLAGGWCWDGMVLLEGCVVSAMRIAEEFGVTVPWAQHED